MARNPSGTYSRVVDPYVDGGVIRADDHNDEHDDFGAELTDSLNRSGKGGMLAPLKLYDGTLASPGAHFTGQTNTGFYLPAAGDLRVALAASDIQKWTAALVRIETALVVNGNLDCNALDATGNATLGGTLDVTGAITGSSIDVSGEAECGTLDCLGNGAVGGTLAVTGNTTIGGTAAAWVPNTAYVIGNQVIANGNLYTCDTDGTSDTTGTGPSGTGTDIADGTTRWDYVSAAATAAVAGDLTLKSHLMLTGPAPVTTTAFTDTLTPGNIVKAHAKVTTDGASGITLRDGFNIASVALSNVGDAMITLTFASNFENTHYTVIPFVSKATAPMNIVAISQQAAGSLEVAFYQTDGTPIPADTNAVELHVLCIGGQ